MKWWIYVDNDCAPYFAMLSFRVISVILGPPLAHRLHLLSNYYHIISDRHNSFVLLRLFDQRNSHSFDIR